MFQRRILASCTLPSDCMSSHHTQRRPNKTDAGNGSKAVCRVFMASRSPSPDPRRSPEIKNMSHQGNDDWYPECLVCGMGNFHGVVCLDPTCHEHSFAELSEPPLDSQSKRFTEDGHRWVSCACCEKAVRADGGAWGTYGICISCFTAYFLARRLPPIGPIDLNRHLTTGVLTRSRPLKISPSNDR